MRSFWMVEFKALCHIIQSSQFCVIGKFAEDAFCPIFNEDVKQNWKKY